MLSIHFFLKTDLIKFIYQQKGLSPKLRSDKWLGPYRVVKAISDVNYRVQLGRRRIVAHYNNLKPYLEATDDLPKTITDDDITSQNHQPAHASTGEHSVTFDGKSVATGHEREGDECVRFDEEGFESDEGDAGEIGAEEQAAVEEQQQQPLMREGGRLWCNVDRRNEIYHGRRRHQT